MQLSPETSNMARYLASSKIIDFENLDIQKTAVYLSKDIEDEIQLIKTVYEFVRDDISKTLENHRFSMHQKSSIFVCFVLHSKHEVFESFSFN